jgi:hypothetical protein
MFLWIRWRLIVKITLEMLKKKDASDKFLLWFTEHFSGDGSPDHTEILQKLDDQKHRDEYGDWLLEEFGLSGTSTWWYINGAKARETHYINGKEHGIENWWYMNGDFDECFYYINGRLVSKKEWKKYEQSIDLKIKKERFWVSSVIPSRGVTVARYFKGVTYKNKRYVCEKEVKRLLKELSFSSEENQK